MAMRRSAPNVLILAMDIGSSSTRSALFDESARVLAATSARREYAVHYSADGGAEVAPLRLRNAAQQCLRETLGKWRSSRLSRIPIAGVGASAFWHSLLGLDRHGRPLTPIYTWADSRCASDAMKLREQFDERRVHAETGCMLRASFWPAKLRWLRRTNRQLFRNVSRWISPADWIFEEIFGGSGSSYSMASATGFYDWRAKSWHQGLCKACGISPEKLGTISSAARRSTSMSGLEPASIFGPIGDGAAGNLGCDADSPGLIAINLGTSAAVRTIENGEPARTPVPFGLFRYAVDGARTVMGGAISNAGNLRRWGERELRVPRSGRTLLSRNAAAADRLTVLPFWVAERAPTWPENLRGALVGLTQSTDAAEIFRASTCAVFYRLAEILALIEKDCGVTKETIVSGGAVHSAAVMALLADALGRDVRVFREGEASLRGAAMYVLEQLGHEKPQRQRGTRVRHNPKLAEKHRARRASQIALESVLSKTAAAMFAEP
jgi:gluconokinase